MIPQRHATRACLTDLSIRSQIRHRINIALDLCNVFYVRVYAIERCGCAKKTVAFIWAECVGENGKIRLVEGVSSLVFMSFEVV